MSYAEDLNPEQFLAAELKGKTYYLHSFVGRVAKLGKVKIVVVKEGLTKPAVAFIAATELSLSEEEILSSYLLRWEAEVYFGDSKELLGFDHYQMRYAKGIVRFWHLANVAYSYLEHLRQSESEGNPTKLNTVGEAKRYQQKVLLREFVLWLKELFAIGSSVDNVMQRLAI